MAAFELSTIHLWDDDDGEHALPKNTRCCGGTLAVALQPSPSSAGVLHAEIKDASARCVLGNISWTQPCLHSVVAALAVTAPDPSELSDNFVVRTLQKHSLANAPVWVMAHLPELTLSAANRVLLSTNFDAEIASVTAQLLLLQSVPASSVNTADSLG